MKDKYIKLKNSRIAYKKWGVGSTTAIAFHRYGGDKNLFKYIGSELQDELSLFAIDLPFHGKSIWEKDAFNAQDLECILRELMKLEAIQKWDIMMGHSMGGRMATCVFASDNIPIQHLLLLTPEGLISLPWYTFLRFINPFRGLIISTFNKWPRAILNITESLVFIKALPKSASNFIRINIEKPHRMRRVSGIWRSYSSFNIKWSKVDSIIRKEGKKGTLLLALKDQILPYKKMKKGAKKISHFDEVALNIQHFVCNSPILLNWMKTFLLKIKS